MNMLIVTATEQEATPLRDKLLQDQDLMNGLSLHWLVTGVGLMATSYALMQHLAQNKKPDLAIQAGIAGSFSSGHPIGSVAAVNTEFYGDLGVMENGKWHDIFDMGLANENLHPWNNKGLHNPHEQLILLSQLHTARGISINQISTRPETINQLSEKYHPDLESMEGAAFHYVCLQQNIPFLQLRSISNFVGERDKNKWNIPLAFDALQKALHHLLSAVKSNQP